MEYYWELATALSCSVMGIALAYLVMEYCTQSHLSTEDYGKAIRGLQRTRRFKKITRWFRVIIEPRLWVCSSFFCCCYCKRRSLLWRSRNKNLPIPMVELGERRSWEVNENETATPILPSSDEDHSGRGPSRQESE